MVWIFGGTISGKSATGRRKIITAPAMTKAIAITIATIGRLIKNFDIELAFVDWRGEVERLRLCLEPWHHPHPICDLLLTFGNDPLAGLEAVVDNPEGVYLRAELDAAQRHSVVGSYYRYLE